MPNHGRSAGCVTCKRRRVKCDEARPICSNCQRLDLCCGGYHQKLSFRDENHKFPKTRNPAIWCRAKDEVHLKAAEPSRSLVTASDLAVPFFLMHCAGLGRSLDAARGFFETLIPAYNSQSQESALVLAVSAVASRIYSMWHPDKHGSTNVQHPFLYVQAVSILRKTIEAPKERHRPATALAILALHLYENISAVYETRSATPAHHHGALALLPVTVSDHLDRSISAYVQNFVLHLEISSALRQKRSVQPNVHRYIMNIDKFPRVQQSNISLDLDFIAAAVADFQADFMSALAAQDSSKSTKYSSRDWISQARRIDGLLQDWENSIPKHWRPMSIVGERDFCASVPTYRSCCDVYPSCQLATIWNHWRMQRILLLKIEVGSAQRNNCSVRNMAARDQNPDVPTNGSSARLLLIQELVDGICDSIPFYLGNRSKPSSTSDFSDPDIRFPSYHSFEGGSAKIAWRRQAGDGTAMLKDEHYRHMVVNGAWHAMSPLSSLLTFCSDEPGGRVIASLLRPGQHDWIREQFIRVGVLLRLPAAKPCYAAKPLAQSDIVLLPPSEIDGSAADGLAQAIRRSAAFMSGP